MGQSLGDLIAGGANEESSKEAQKAANVAEAER